MDLLLGRRGTKLGELPLFLVLYSMEREIGDNLIILIERTKESNNPLCMISCTGLECMWEIVPCS